MRAFRTLLLWWSILLLASALLHAEGAFKYSYLLKKVYENQVFPVTIIDTRTTKEKITYRFDFRTGIRPLSTKPLVIRNGNDNFYTFYYKAKDEMTVTIPRITIRTSQEKFVLPSQSIAVEKLSAPRSFCGVLAADLKMKNHQVSHYDESNYLVTLALEAYEANLEDMYLAGATEYGVESLKRHGAKVKGEFYVVVPTSTKSLDFSYYNTIKGQYIMLHVPVSLMDSSVVTQSDLNPKEDSFEKLKKYSLMALAGFFVLMFLLYRDIFYLVLGTVSIITLLTFYTPKKKVCIKQGAPLYILPTENSTVSTKVEKKMETVLLGERLNYKKIEYKNGMIGWVKDEDLCKN